MKFADQEKTKIKQYTLNSLLKYVVLPPYSEYDWSYQFRKDKNKFVLENQILQDRLYCISNRSKEKYMLPFRGREKNIVIAAG